jgi:transposase-like protein
MTRKERKCLAAAEKVKAVKKVLVDKKSISEVCEELGIAPSAFYLWQKQLFEGAEAIFIRSPGVKLKNHIPKSELLTLKPSYVNAKRQ